MKVFEKPLKITESKKDASTLNAAAIIAGSGIGSGIMAVPYLVEKAGLIGGIAAFFLAYIVSVLLHLMIAEMALKIENSSDILSVFDRFLFQGRIGKPLKVLFLILMAVVLITDLAAYISGAYEILADFLPVHPVLLQTGFWILAAIVILPGLQALSVSETISVAAMGVLTLTGLLLSVLNVNTRAVSEFLTRTFFVRETVKAFPACFSMIMFSFSALFAVPQAVEYLDKDPVKVRKSVFLGFLINLIFSVITAVSAIIASENVTEVAIVGWASFMEGSVRVIGSALVLLAMFTSYWSIGLAAKEIAVDLLKIRNGAAFLAATFPSLLLTLVLGNGFLQFMKIAGGAVAVIISLMIIPSYLFSKKYKTETVIKKNEGSFPAAVFVFLMYLLMAAGSMTGG